MDKSQAMKISIVQAKNVPQRSKTIHIVYFTEDYVGNNASLVLLIMGQIHSLCQFWRKKDFVFLEITNRNLFKYKTSKKRDSLFAGLSIRNGRY